MNVAVHWDMKVIVMNEIYERLRKLGCYTDNIKEMTTDELFKYVGKHRDSNKRLSDNYLRTAEDLAEIQEEILESQERVCPLCNSKNWEIHGVPDCNCTVFNCLNNCPYYEDEYVCIGHLEVIV